MQPRPIYFEIVDATCALFIFSLKISDQNYTSASIGATPNCNRSCWTVGTTVNISESFTDEFPIFASGVTSAQPRALPSPLTRYCVLALRLRTRFWRILRLVCRVSIAKAPQTVEIYLRVGSWFVEFKKIPGKHLTIAVWGPWSSRLISQISKIYFDSRNESWRKSETLASFYGLEKWAG